MLIRLTGTLTAVIVFVTLLALSFGAQKTPPRRRQAFRRPEGRWLREEAVDRDGRL